MREAQREAQDKPVVFEEVVDAEERSRVNAAAAGMQLAPYGKRWAVR